jgi:hypothetical protein
MVHLHAGKNDEAGVVPIETAVRYVGWVCQVAGFALAAYGITQTRREWAPDRLSVVSKLSGSLNRWGLALLVRLHLRRRRTHTVEIADAAHAHATVHAILTQSYADPPEDATVEDRLGVVEERIQQLVQRNNDLTRSLDEKDRKTTEAIATERAARDEEIARLDQRVRDLATGGLRLDARVLALVFIGVTFGTVPDFIARLLRVLTPLP